VIGQTISHYRILEKLGEGGMGVVYRAEDTKLKRDVAIKFLPRNVASNGGERKRLMIEAQAAAALNHPNIATIHAIEESDDDIFIVMEYVEGRELKEKIAQAPLSVDEAIAIAVQIADGLKVAHTKGIVHRDIKSSNIMLTGSGQVKIMDFGLAKIGAGSEMTKAGSTIGTIAYMSPEQTRGEDVDQRTDIWSLGIVMYEMLAGQLPFAHEYDHAIMYSILNEQPKPIGALRTGTPEALAAVVTKAMAKDRESRYQSADDVLADLKYIGQAQASDRGMSVSIRDRIKLPRTLIPIIAAVVLATVAVWWAQHMSAVRWAREEGLQGIEQAVQDGVAAEGKGAWTAFALAGKVGAYIPDDPLFNRLLPRFSRTVRIYSTPAGASVYAKSYSDPESEWQYFGQTPIDSVRFPLGFSRIKIEKAGYRPALDLGWNSSWVSDTLLFRLAEEGSVPDGMELVPDAVHWHDIAAAPAGLHMPGMEHLEAVEVGQFFMDRYEVTNKNYKQFVDAGGYKDRVHWKHPFVMGNQVLMWEEAMKLFVDKTGQPGPSTWEVGDYPAGKGDYPVAGVSWYEAAAYAAFLGKSLPTIYHWDRVAFTWASPVITPASNLRGDGPIPVGSSTSMNRFGVYDLSGNVREWCFNESERSGRFILGGGWNDPAYAFNDAYAQPPFDRSETNGFRCIAYIDSGKNRSALEQKIVMPFRDFLKEPIASDGTFALYVSQYGYDKTPLNAIVESVKDEGEWVREKISFNAAYGGERMMAYLFLPKKGTPPYQTVVIFPGSGAIHTRSSEALSSAGFDFFLKSGRAVMYPVYKSTYERGDDLHSDYPDETNFWKEHVIMWAKDFSRSVDYLETRKEIDAGKIAYYGVSWGGAMGGIIPAIEKRIQVSVMLVAGLLFQRSLPEVDPLHFLPRITSPVLMLNGKYDFFFPYETSQKPFFELLGTRNDDKKIIAYEGGHSVPRTQLVKEALSWLDQYLGTIQ
jgi:predicted Ser/Thr protein kinase/dienelactone hydrolase